MINPIRLQLSRAAGFHLQTVSRIANGLPAVNVARPHKYGNPYRAGDVIDLRQAARFGWQISPQGKKLVCADNLEAARRFTHGLIWDAAIHQAIRDDLGGHNLACWCGLDQPCHSNPLLFVANSTPDEIDRLHYELDQRIIDAGELLLRARLQ